MNIVLALETLIFGFAKFEFFDNILILLYILVSVVDDEFDGDVVFVNGFFKPGEGVVIVEAFREPHG